MFGDADFLRGHIPLEIVTNSDSLFVPLPIVRVLGLVRPFKNPGLIFSRSTEARHFTLDAGLMRGRALGRGWERIIPH